MCACMGVGVGVTNLVPLTVKHQILMCMYIVHAYYLCEASEHSYMNFITIFPHVYFIVCIHT